MLCIRNLEVTFGGIKALRDLSLMIPLAGITAIIGPNGAGKTTLFNSISRLAAAVAGQISYKEIDLLKLAPHEVIGIGIARTFQSPPILEGVKGIELVRFGGYIRSHSTFPDILVNSRKHRQEESDIDEKARRIIELTGLEDVAGKDVSELSYGDVKKLDIARAMMASPSLLLMDEPAAGLNTREKEGLQKLIVALKTQGIAIALIEHDMRMVMGLADRVIVLAEGHVLAEGMPIDITKDRRVIEAYLGDAAW